MAPVLTRGHLVLSTLAVVAVIGLVVIVQRRHAMSVSLVDFSGAPVDMLLLQHTVQQRDDVSRLLNQLQVCAHCPHDMRPSEL